MGLRAKYLWLLLLMSAFWGGSLAVVQAMSHYLTAGQIVTMRFGVAWLVLQVLWPWLPGESPRGRELARAAIIGLLVFVLGQRLQVWGNLLDTAANSSVLMCIEPLLAAVAASLFLREHIDGRRWIGFVLGITGVLVLNRVWQPGFKWTNLTASLIFVSSFFCETCYSILGKPLADRRRSPWKVLTVAVGAATIANLLLDGPSCVAVVGKLPLVVWFYLFYMSVICTIIGYSIWLMAIKEIPVNVVSMTIFLQPLAGIPVAVVWLGEPLHWGQLWGACIIAAGLWIALGQNNNGAGSNAHQD